MCWTGYCSTILKLPILNFKYFINVFLTCSRYRDTNEEVDLVKQETIHLEKLKQKIEERKKLNNVTKTPDIITLKLQPKTHEREANLIPQDKNTVKQENEEIENKEVKIENKLFKEKLSSEFKVLGTNEFEKKIKVRMNLHKYGLESYD